MKSYKTMMDEIINKIDEDAPTNAVGDGGNVALPPKHEPGVDKKKKKDPILGTLKRKVQESNDNNNVVLKGVESIINKLEEKIDEISGVVKEEIKIETPKRKKTIKEKAKL
tara:strand:- start:249 stop:581 length:333 start_codon:yes stop_codon:yes gene_type:complete